MKITPLQDKGTRLVGERMGRWYVVKCKHHTQIMWPVWYRLKIHDVDHT
jgi:hypothetical protein